MIYLSTDLLQFEFLLSPFEMNLTSFEVEKINLSWDELQRENSSLYSGTQFSCHKIELVEGKIIVHLHQLDYKVHVWAKKNRKNMTGFHPVGVGVTGYDEETEEFVMMQRGNNVSVYKNLIGSVGGSLDHSEHAFNDFSSYLRESALKEIGEEIEIENPESIKLEYVCATYEEGSSNLVFRFLLRNKMIGLKNEEHTGFVRVHRLEFNQFLVDNSERIAITTKPSLEYISILSSLGKI